MVRRQIELDEETDRLLKEFAQSYGGDLGKAVADLVHGREGVERFVDQCEESQQAFLRAQRERSERDFREGQTTTWDNVKRRNGL